MLHTGNMCIKWGMDRSRQVAWYLSVLQATNWAADLCSKYMWGGGTWKRE